MTSRTRFALRQRVGHAELEFLVTSGAYFGFVLGVLQMYAWMVVPKPWTLPLAGALVGYATNWIAIKMLFDPAEPIHLHTPLGPFVLQGLFEKRQVEVSEEFARFLSQRVLTSPRLIDELANGNLRENFERVLRRAVPFVVPDAVVVAAANGLRDVALESMEHPTHVYVAERLGVQPTLCRRLQALSPVDFEDLLHPVFQARSRRRPSRRSGGRGDLRPTSLQAHMRGRAPSLRVSPRVRRRTKSSSSSSAACSALRQGWCKCVSAGEGPRRCGRWRRARRTKERARGRGAVRKFSFCDRYSSAECATSRVPVRPMKRP